MPGRRPRAAEQADRRRGIPEWGQTRQLLEKARCAEYSKNGARSQELATASQHVGPVGGLDHANAKLEIVHAEILEVGHQDLLGRAIRDIRGQAQDAVNHNRAETSRMRTESPFPLRSRRERCLGSVTVWVASAPCVLRDGASRLLRMTTYCVWHY